MPPLRFHCVGKSWGWTRTVATLGLAVRRSNHSARSRPYSTRSHPYSTRSNPYSTRSNPYSARSHTYSARSYPYSARSHPYSARSHPYSARSARSHPLWMVGTGSASTLKTGSAGMGSGSRNTTHHSQLNKLHRMSMNQSSTH